MDEKQLPESGESHPAREELTLAEATKVWARIGLMSFGGPAAQIALMHRELVEQRQWISEGRFLHALNYCMLLPGPEAMQLAVYIGWLMHKTKGGLIAGFLFVLPGFLTILGLSVAYVSFSHLAWVEAAFFGIKAAILAVVLEAVIRIGKRALIGRMMIGIAAMAFVAIHFLDVSFPLIILASALYGIGAYRVVPHMIAAPRLPDAVTSDRYLVDRQISEGRLPHIRVSRRQTAKAVIIWTLLWLTPIAVCSVWLGPDHIFSQIGLFFGKAAVVTFGGAYSVLAYVAQQAVDTYNWLVPGEMLDGLALAETTPGPLIMVVQFVGYIASFRADSGAPPIVAGVIGSLLTTWVTFAPCFLWIFAGAPYVEVLHGNKWMHAALSSITAAVVGVVLNLSIWFAVHVLFNEVSTAYVGPVQFLQPDLRSLSVPSAVIVILSILATLRFHIGIGKTLTASAIAGFAWHTFAG